MLPCTREENLVIQELGDETVVYDLQRHKAHSLNVTASLVWKHCDGETTVADIAARLMCKLDTAVTEDVVWLALQRLDKAHLLRESLDPQPTAASLSRRELGRRLRLVGALSLLVPVVTSIVAPTPARAALSCTPVNTAGCPARACCPGTHCVAGVCI